MRRWLPSVFYNTVSMVGMTIFAINLGLIFFLFALDYYSGSKNAYMGILTWIVFPGFMIFGLLVAFFGLFRTIRRQRKGIESKPLPVIDLNRPRQRNAFTMFFVGGIFLMALSGFGSFKAYEYTESVQFCGTTCHIIMKPEYTAYQASPHARVPCARCHIGSGADWYVRSKLSGLYQVYSTIFNKYHRPIETPVRNLRPAKDTCEECHWPNHFYSQKLRDRTYYLSDEKNTPAEMSMLVKIGGEQQGNTEGIHAHMYIDNEITYISTDRQRQVIPYVEAKDKSGKVTVYQSTELKATPDELKKGERRLVDCIDCHNRPSHQYNHPEFSVNHAMSKGRIDTSLPEIKRVSVEALEKPYKTESEALAGIKKDVEEFYKTTYPKQAASMSKQIQVAIEDLQGIYKVNYFPEMGVSWKGYPNNLDHLHGLGCFRCHDGKHVSKEGKVITKDCKACHIIISQVPPGGKRETNRDGLEFKHPADIGDAWKETPCKDCHAASEGG
ncbi:MAG: NapC/NirT family cytochrome c [Fimbriimonadales bacterium]